MKLLSLVLIYFMPLIACAHDWGAREGLMLNQTERVLSCLYDSDGAVRSYRVRPGMWCHGDAIGTIHGEVFKVPNRSRWFCSDTPAGLSCEPSALLDETLFVLARLRHGQERYGRMTWSGFSWAMTAYQGCAVEEDE